jgi:hypothetical protein
MIELTPILFLIALIGFIWGCVRVIDWLNSKVYDKPTIHQGVNIAGCSGGDCGYHGYGGEARQTEYVNRGYAVERTARRGEIIEGEVREVRGLPQPRRELPAPEQPIEVEIVRHHGVEVKVRR